MPSWSWNDWEPDTPFEAERRMVERERLRDGWQPQEGWRRPVDPPCPTHGYGLVGGLCGMCLLDLADAELAA